MSLLSGVVAFGYNLSGITCLRALALAVLLFLHILGSENKTNEILGKILD